MKQSIMPIKQIDDAFMYLEAERPYIEHVFFFYTDKQENDKEFIFELNLN